MKKFVIIGVIILSYLSIYAQQTFNYPILLLPLAEHTVIKINGVERELESLLICINNDQIEIRKGKLSLLDTDGNEIILKEGEIIEIDESSNQEDSNMKIITMSKISKFMNKPSSYLPNLYNNERNEFVIFPLKSKVYNKANIKFYLSQDFIPEMKLNIYLKDSDSLIWCKDGTAKEFNFQNAPLEPGKSYTWRLYNGSNSIKGNFELLTEDQIQKMSMDSIKNKMDYLSLFFIFLENECKFDALTILDTAINQYPQSELFKKLLSKFPVDINELK